MSRLFVRPRGTCQRSGATVLRAGAVGIRLTGVVAVVAAVTCQPVALAGPTIAADTDAIRATRADSTLRAMVPDGFAGSVLVARGGDILLHHHYGLDVPAGTTPSYWLASITKQFTAAAILAFVETGEFMLADSLGGLLPSVPGDKRAITVLQLLTHTSGLPQAYAADGVVERDSALAAILALPLERPPGSGFGYSNDNYSLLAILLEIAGDVGYESFHDAFFFKASGMRHTGFWGEPVPEGTWIPTLADTVSGSLRKANWGFRGGVGVRASVEDLFRWMQALRNGRPLAPSTVSTLLGPHLTLESGTGIGCGWFTTTREDGTLMRFTRGQEQYGANAVIYLLPEEDLIVITATHAGPPETGDGPVTGWSRITRDLLLQVFAPPR